MNKKTCSVCLTEKDFEHYYKQVKRKKNGESYVYLRPDCKTCCKQKSTTWIKNNKEQFKKNLKRYKDKPELKEMQRKYNEKWRGSGGLRKWHINNKERLKIYSLKRNTKNHEITVDEWIACKNYFNYSCAYCGLSEKEHRIKFRQDLHKEHVKHNGANNLSNCVPACKTCNSSKQNSSLLRWYIEKGFFNFESLKKINQWLLHDYKQFIRNKNKGI